MLGFLARLIGPAIMSAASQVLGSILGDKLQDLIAGKKPEPKPPVRPQIRIEREESSDEGTFGHLEYGALLFKTGELPWRDNKDDLSCIPAGTYLCQKTFSPKYQRPMYLVTGVPGREGVRIHSMNYVGDKTKGLACDAEGCIGLGREIGKLGDQKAILKSRDAVKAFEDALAGQDFELTIVDPPGGLS